MIKGVLKNRKKRFCFYGIAVFASSLLFSWLLTILFTQFKYMFDSSINFNVFSLDEPLWNDFCMLFPKIFFSLLFFAFIVAHGFILLYISVKCNKYVFA